MNLFASATTTDTVSAEPATAVSALTSGQPAASAHRPADLAPVRPNRLQRLGGLGLIAAPLLFTGGMLTSPEQTAPGNEGYIQSLAADPALSIASANFLHYGWVAVAFGAIASLGLLRGPRGRIWVSIAAVVLMLGSIQMSGLLLSDWFLVSAGNQLSIEDAVAMDGAAKEWSVGIWQMSGMIGGILGIAALALGLARAKAVSWWIAPLAFLPWILPAFGLGLVGVFVALACYAPLFVAGVRLVRAR